MRRSIGETVHDARPGQVLHLDYLHVRASGSLKEAGLDEWDGFRHILVTVDDSSNFVSLQPAVACTAVTIAKHLLRVVKP